MTLDELEAMSDHSVAARRNLSVGLWAGKRIGFRGAQLERYVHDVMESDRLKPGFEDVVSKIRRDFLIHGVAFREDELPQKIMSLERAIRIEFAATD
jgi:hypothetical protein